MDSLTVPLSVGVALTLVLVQKVPLVEKVCVVLLLTLVLTVRTRGSGGGAPCAAHGARQTTRGRVC